MFHSWYSDVQESQIAPSSAFALAVVLAAVHVVDASHSLPVEDDPLVRMPGTQPQRVTLEAPYLCPNRHADYNSQVELGFNWKGSMTAQVARDFLFWACMTAGAQDSVWAAGRPGPVDICERCHFPKGCLEGRSDLPSASASMDADFDGVQCDVCHTMYDPFFETAYPDDR